MFRLFVFTCLFYCPFILTAQTPYIHADSVINAGIELHDEGNYDEAIALYDQVHEGDTSYLRAVAEKMNTLLKLERFDESIRLGNYLLSVPNPYHSMAYNALGNAYDNAGKSDSAVMMYKKGLELYPYDYLLHFNLGTTYKRQDNIQKAMEEFKAVLKINPFHPGSHLSMGIIAAEMGYYTRAQLSMSMYLSIVPGNNSVLVALNDMFIGKWDLFNTREPVLDNSDFEEIDLVVASKAATDDKFKSAIEFKAPVAQQSELILELLENNPESDDFWMQFYVPLYSRLQVEELAPAFIYHIIRSANNEDINKWLKKNDKELNRFFELANQHLYNWRAEREAVVGGVKDLYSCWYYEQRQFNAIGKENADEDNIGPFEFYHSNQELSAIGAYDDKGYKVGPWKYYFRNGVLSKEEVFDDNGDVNNPVIIYFENGALDRIIPYKDNAIEGVARLHFLSGELKEDIPVKNGLKHGQGTGYYPTGAKNFEYTYEEGKLQGTFTYYFAGGELSQTLTYKDDVLEGPFRDYFQNGVLYQEGDYADNKLTGKWVLRHDNNQISGEGDYKNDKRVGTWKYYSRDGLLTEVETYNEEGQIIREEIMDDADGKLHSVHEYENERLIAYAYYDKQGNTIREEKNKNGNMSYEGTYPDGSPWIKGKYKGGKREGLFSVFRKSGSLISETLYVAGETHGLHKSYHESGEISQEIEYENDQQNGYAKEYYEDGTLMSEGWIVDGTRQQRWVDYHPNGQISSEYFLVNNENNGPVKTYDPEGRLVKVETYYRGLPMQVEQYDTAGNVYHTLKLNHGTGTYELKFANGKVSYRTELKGGSNDTDIEQYDLSGKKVSTYPIVENVVQGSFTDHHTNGKISIEGQYQNGYREGHWIYYDRDGNKAQEMDYYRDQLHGTSVTYFESGQPSMIREYQFDEPVGSTKSFTRDGTLMVEKFYDKHGITGYRYLDKSGNLTDTIRIDMRDGEVRAFYPNGQPSVVQQYKNGVFDGELIDYHPNGQMMERLTYKLSVKDGVNEAWYEDGTLRYKATYKGDQLDGKEYTYYPDGTLESETEYIHGVKHGEEIFYDKKGNVIEKRLYRNGKWY